MDSLISSDDHLRAELVYRLRPMMARRPGTHVHGEGLFSYCVIDRERLVAIRPQYPIIGIILQGAKEIWLGDVVARLTPGTVFVLPAGKPLDVVNIPGATGLYESLIMEVRDIPDAVPPLTAAERRLVAGPAFRVGLTPDLCHALIHAATTIADDTAADMLKTMRLTEVLTLLRPIPAARGLFHRNLSGDVAWLLARAPSEAWTVERLAGVLGLGASTLRRRLAAEGRSFRVLLRDARLNAARRILDGGASSLAAAEASGYTSRSHFARRYRQRFGISPRGR